MILIDCFLIVRIVFQCEAMSKAKGTGLTSFKSRPFCRQLCKKLAFNGFEKTLMAMASEKKTRNSLDLGTDAAGPIASQVQQLSQLYTADFQPTPAAEQTVKHRCSTSEDAVVSVRLSSEIIDEEEYKLKHALWEKEKEQWDDEQLAKFVNGHIGLIVWSDHQGVDDLKKKTKKCEVLNEKKRKAFVLDELTMSPLPWDKLKKSKKTVFAPVKPSNDLNDHLDVLMELYAEHRHSEDGQSDDIVMALVPGAMPNSYHNEAAEKTIKKFKAHTPKLQAPKKGDIQKTHADLFRVRGQHQKLAFAGASDPSMIFTQQKKGSIAAQSQMKYLHGDLVRNVWSVRAMPPSQMLTMTPLEAKDLFDDSKADAEFGDYSDDEAMPPHPDEINGDKAVVYPGELPAELSQEIHHVFGADVQFRYGCGSGKCFEGTLLERKWALTLACYPKQFGYVLQNCISLVHWACSVCFIARS